MSESDKRWAKAERYARGYADLGMGDALRVYYTRYFPLGVVLYAIALALLGSVLSGDSPTDWSTFLRFGGIVFGLLAVIAGLIYNAKRIKPRVELGDDLPIIIGLEQDEQKYIRQVISGKEPPPRDPVRRAVARSVAVHDRKTNATNLLIVPLYTYGLVYIPGSLFIVWILLGASVLAVVFLFSRDFRRAGRFLTATAPQEVL